MQKCGRCKVNKPLEEYAPSYRGRPGTQCRACDFIRKHERNVPAAPHDPVACSMCDTLFVPKQMKPFAVRFCSKKCGRRFRAVRLTQHKAATLQRACIHCGIDLPPTMRTDAKFCSARCNSAAHAVTRKMSQRARRARTPGDPLVERNAIAKRDNYCCGICGGHVDMRLRHPDPMSPSIDHVIPLARGGGNDMDNLQLAHLACNLSKRALLPEEHAAA